MNIFHKVLESEYAGDTRLGCPSADYGAYRRRMHAMATMRMSDGFRIPPRGPKLSRGGKTRAELEAPLKAIFARNLEAEIKFREQAKLDGMSIAAINRAIEQRKHLKR